MATSVEEFLRRINNPIGFQILVVILLATNYFPLAFNNLQMLYYATTPRHHCKMPEEWAWHRNASIPKKFENGQYRLDECSMYQDPADHTLGLKGCIYGWQYYIKPPEWTIVTEWNLVCSRENLVSQALHLYPAGGLIGGLVIGTLADRFGRKPLMLAALLSHVVLGFLTFFVNRYLYFAVLRTAQGFLMQGLDCTTFVMVMELARRRNRTLVGITCFGFYAFASMFLVLLGFRIQHWRFIQLAITIPSLICIFYIWLIPESLRWLATCNKTEDVTAVVYTYAKFNNVEAVRDLEGELEGISKEMHGLAPRSYDIRDLFRTKQLRRNTLLHSFCWFTSCMVSNGMKLFTPEVTSNKYLNYFLDAKFELISYILAFFIFNRFGRRRPLFVFFVLGGVLCIIAVLVDDLPKNNTDRIKGLVMFLGILSKACFTASIAGLYIFSSETFPTVIRTTGIATCAFWKLIGGMVAPHIFLLRKSSLKAIPVILYGAVAMIAAFIVLMLPETSHRPLPDSVAEAEELEEPKDNSNAKSLPTISDKINGNSGCAVSPVPATEASQIAVLQTETETDTLESAEKRKISNDKTGEREEINAEEEATEEEEALTESEEVEEEDETSRRSSAKSVRFLGIDVLNENHASTLSGAIVEMMPGFERKVRFSNVVFDIEQVLLEEERQSQENIATDEQVSSEVKEDVEKGEENEIPIAEDEPSVTTSEEASPTVKVESPPPPITGILCTNERRTSNIIPVRRISQERIACVRPIMGILKKSSKEEDKEKRIIIKSPHPLRKISSLPVLPVTQEQEQSLTEDEEIFTSISSTEASPYGVRKVRETATIAPHRKDSGLGGEVGELSEEEKPAESEGYGSSPSSPETSPRDTVLSDDTKIRSESDESEDDSSLSLCPDPLPDDTNPESDYEIEEEEPKRISSDASPDLKRYPSNEISVAIECSNPKERKRKMAMSWDKHQMHLVKLLNEHGLTIDNEHISTC